MEIFSNLICLVKILSNRTNLTATVLFKWLSNTPVTGILITFYESLTLEIEFNNFG